MAQNGAPTHEIECQGLWEQDSGMVGRLHLRGVRRFGIALPVDHGGLGRHRPGDADGDGLVFGLSAAQLSRRITAAHACPSDGYSGRSGRVDEAVRTATHSDPIADVMRESQWHCSAVVTHHIQTYTAGKWL